MKNLLSLATKKRILILAFSALIIILLAIGLPSKLFKSLLQPATSSPKDSQGKLTANLSDKTKPYVVTKKIIQAPVRQSPGGKTSQPKIVTKKIPSQPLRQPEKSADPSIAQKLEGADRKMTKPAKITTKAPDKPQPADSMATTGEVGLASQKSAMVKSNISSKAMKKKLPLISNHKNQAKYQLQIRLMKYPKILS